MKKIFLQIVAIMSLAVAANAVTLDKDTLKLEFEGFKTPDFIATKGSITKVDFQFGKDTSSLSSTLQGAKAIIDPKDIDMQVDEITNNIKNVFFATFNKGAKFEVEVINVVEGNNQGLISTKVKINKEWVNLPLHYMIKGDDFHAHGTFDLSSFKNASLALKALSDAAPGHAGISWPLVKITLDGKTK